MKSKLLAIALLLISTTSSFATHIMGGQITSRNIGGLTYEVTLKVYRDTNGIPVSSVFINYDNNANVNLFASLIFSSTSTAIGNGVEEYVFVDIFTFPAIGYYHIRYNECCRNAAILNIPNPDNYGIYISNTLLVDPTNSSPEFLNPPIPVAQLNTPFNYNPLPFDIDGDSIAWTLDTPLDGIGSTSNMIPGYTLPSADSSMPFTMNPLTGEVSFLPNLDGHFVASFLISEYRGGNKIGEIRRDMQIIVIPTPNAPIIASAICNTFPYTGRNFNINIGSTFTLNVSGIDFDTLTVGIIASGAPFQSAANPAIFTSTTSPGTATGQFTWTPLTSQIQSPAYIMAIRLTEEYGGFIFGNDITYNLRVGNFTGIIDQIQADVINNVFPNPSKGSFALELNIHQPGAAVYTVRNLIGQQMFTNIINLNTGINVIEVNNPRLQAGKYFITIEQEGKITGEKALEIIN